MADCYGANPRLLPTVRMKEVDVARILPRVPEGHYVQWINACRAGYGKNELSSSFDYAGPFTESVLLGALAVRAYHMKGANGKGNPGRTKLLWDARQMTVTNVPEANKFVKRDYRSGWAPL